MLLVKMHLQKFFQIYDLHMPLLVKKQSRSPLPALPQPKHSVIITVFNLQHALGPVRSLHMVWVSFKSTKVSQHSVLSLKI